MKLLALDGNSIFNRAFYGIRLLTTKSGEYTNAIYGFLAILLKLLDETQPDSIAVAFDRREKTFRHLRYDGYKATRKGMPPELAAQFEPLKEILRAMGINLLDCAGYEADDILGTLAACAKKNGDCCVIATGDRDSLQLVGGGVTVRLTATRQGRPETVLYDEEAIRAEFGVAPVQMIDVKALQGDNSDNIPGVAGVGPKTALGLIAQFGSLDGVYEHIDDSAIRPGVRQKLLADRESAYLSRELGEIFCAVPVPCEAKELARRPMDSVQLRTLLTRLELFSMIPRMGLDEMPQPEREAEAPQPAPQVTVCEGAVPAGVGRIFAAADADDTGRLRAAALLADGKIYYAENNISELIPTGCEIFSEDAKLLHKALLLDGREEKICMDAGVAAYLLNPASSRYDVPRLAQEYGVAMTAAGESDRERLFARVLALPELCEVLTGRLEQDGLRPLFEQVELPLTRVLAQMELEGFEVDKDGIRTFGEGLFARIGELERQIYELVGYSFNLNSPKQLGEALFVKLGLPAKKKTKSGYSTQAEVLEELADAHPAVSLLLEYRKLTKLYSTYCDGLLKAIGRDGRVHSTLNQTETRTGRISSTDPNLQNIPIRTELGREMRRFFVAREGWTLIDADYSQIELRVLAHMAGDEAMIAAFQSGEDIHRITASQVFGMPPELVTPQMRSSAKAVNFGIVYGIGAFSLAKDIGVSVYEAKKYIEGYLNTYSGVRAFMEKSVAEAKERGYAQTMFGRRRYLPELSSSNRALRAFGERVAMNMPIQGTAADIIKIAMVRVAERLRESGLKARLILQVHDELIVEAPVEEAEQAKALLVSEMEGAAKMAAPLIAEAGVGKTWYDAH